MFCTNCGNKIKEKESFCTNCGKSKIKDEIKPKYKKQFSYIKTKSLKILGFLKKIKLNKKEWVILGVIGIITIIFIFFGYFRQPKKLEVGTNTKSIVNIVCDNDNGGSGVIFTSDGLIITNNHVVEGSTTCLISIPNPDTGKIEEVYEAIPTITKTLSKKYDVATLKINDIFIDEDGKIWGSYPIKVTPFILPNTCDTNAISKLGDSIRVYGYPVTSGGVNLTITDGIISSFTNEGEILTTAQIDSGNSGGLAIDQNGCWLGIPSAVVSGDYQNLGVIIPGSVVKSFLETVPAKLNPIADNIDYSKETEQSQEKDNEVVCQESFGIYSEWTGKFNNEGNPTCVCQDKYSWDGSGNVCVLKSSLLKECQNKYGYGSFQTTEDGKAVCGCSNGYIWNEDETKCISDTSLQNTQNKYNCENKKASGSVVLFNNTNNPQKIILNTRLTHDSDLIFRTDESFTIPAAEIINGNVIPGKYQTTMKAENFGSKYIIGPNKFSIPGFIGSDKYNEIYAETYEYTNCD
jgi:hypothetical protein